MIRLLYFCILMSAPLFGICAEGNKNGEIRIAEKTEVWDEDFKEWVKPEVFWENYAMSKGGITWGVGKQYPQYDQVKEHDTIMIQTDSGLCLMEFFHTRWRRANDVWKWDSAFNAYGGCPDVFK